MTGTKREPRSGTKPNPRTPETTICQVRNQVGNQREPTSRHVGTRGGDPMGTPWSQPQERLGYIEPQRSNT